MKQILFVDRRDAGKALAKNLKKYVGQKDTIVLALPRGGVPVGFEVAKALNLPLDVFIVRKLGVPGHEELAMGAIASGGTSTLNTEILEANNISTTALASVLSKEQEELKRREALYRESRLPLNLEGKTVILVDDGMATGATMRVAGQAILHYVPKRVIIATPVASVDACDAIREEFGEETCVCLNTPEPFSNVGMWYEHFPQIEDTEVILLLKKSERA